VKIVHLESGRHRYGGARQVGYLIEGLRRRGVENVLICVPGHPLAANRPREEIRVLPMGGDLDIAMVPRLRRTFAAIEPDVVHVHSRRGADLYGGLACALDQRPAVLTRRVDSAELPAWVRWKVRPYRRIVAISRAVEADLCDRIRIAPERVARITSAVDDRLFRPDRDARARVLREFALADDAIVAAVSAQLIGRKGHRFLFASLPEIAARHPRLRVLCFGRGPLRARLQRQVAELGLGSVVRFAGFRDDLAALLPGADLVVHPAEREGLGVAVLEAMSCGVPVVATAVGGIPDVVADAVDGLLVPSGDRRGLAAAIERMIADGAARQRFALAARIRVQREFSIQMMADRYLELYRDVCGSTRAAL
jgi:glycosyltransferase involved in cell wall biosynthesis